MAELHAAQALGFEADHARERYERLRDQHLHGSGEEIGPDRERFAGFGLAGLFDPDPPRCYVLEIHEAKAPWWGRVDPREAALRDLVRLVLGDPATRAF